MPENPLLPNADLRALLELTRRCANLDATAARKLARQPAKARRGSQSAALQSSAVLGSREALLAGTLLQLRPGDLLAAEPGDTTALTLAPTAEGTERTSLLPATVAAPSRLMLSVAMAAALRAIGSNGLVLHCLRADTRQTSWAESLAWAQERLLPLILVCANARGSGAFQPRTAQAGAAQPGAVPRAELFAWEAVRRATRKIPVPILTVDGEDAVAVYRVMQESVLRARSGAGPAMLWAMLPSVKDLRAPRSRAARPVGRLERYLKTRKLL